MLNVNTIRLVRFYQGVDGLKTGFTDEAGYCLTATAKKENMRLITVVMNEPNTASRSSDTSKMLDYGYNVYMVKNIIDENTVIDKVEVELGKELKIDIVPKETITILSKKSDENRNITYEAKLNKLVAPIKKGTKVGTINIIENGEIISVVDATVAKDIKKANFLTILLRNIKDVMIGDLKF